jgi:hypothetical protein
LVTHQSPLDEIDYARIDSMQLDRIGRSQNCRYATPSKVGEERHDIVVEEKALAGQRFVEQDRARLADERLRQTKSLQQAC